MRIIFLFVWGCFLTLPVARGQTLSPTLLASAADHGMLSGFGSLDWSVGEIMVEKFENGDVLTQGFHQVFVIVTSEEIEPQAHAFSMELFPNPTTGRLHIRSERGVKTRVFNLLGELISSTSAFDFNPELDLSSLPDGMYLIEVVAENYDRPRIFKVALNR